MTTLKQAARIERRVRRHNNLMNLIEAQGVDRETASKLALKILQSEKN